MFGGCKRLRRAAVPPHMTRVDVGGLDGTCSCAIVSIHEQALLMTTGAVCHGRGSELTVVTGFGGSGRMPRRPPGTSEPLSVPCGSRGHRGRPSAWDSFGVLTFAARDSNSGPPGQESCAMLWHVLWSGPRSQTFGGAEQYRSKRNSCSAKRHGGCPQGAPVVSLRRRGHRARPGQVHRGRVRGLGAGWLNV